MRFIVSGFLKFKFIYYSILFTSFSTLFIISPVIPVFESYNINNFAESDSNPNSHIILFKTLFFGSVFTFYNFTLYFSSNEVARNSDLATNSRLTFN